MAAPVDTVSVCVEAICIVKSNVTEKRWVALTSGLGDMRVNPAFDCSVEAILRV